MASTTGTISVLFVDDDESVRETVVWLLQDLGYAVRGVGGAGEALAVLEAVSVDIVLTDVNMPEMDGVQLREQIRVRWPALPVLLTSGRARPADADDAFLPKPFDIASLLGALQRLAQPPGRRQAYA